MNEAGGVETQRRLGGWRMLWWVLVPAPMAIGLSVFTSLLPFVFAARAGLVPGGSELGNDLGLAIVVFGLAGMLLLVVTFCSTLVIALFTRRDIRTRVVWISVGVLLVVIPVLTFVVAAIDETLHPG